MQNIKRINDPMLWKVLSEEKKDNDTIYNVEIGSISNYFQEGALTLKMSRDIFEKILLGEYRIEKCPYEDNLIKIYDEDDDEISSFNYINNKKTIKISSNYSYPNGNNINIRMVLRKEDNQSDFSLDDIFKNNDYNFDIVAIVNKLKEISSSYQEKSLNVIILNNTLSREVKYKKGKLCYYSSRGLYYGTLEYSVCIDNGMINIHMPSMVGDTPGYEVLSSEKEVISSLDNNINMRHKSLTKKPDERK